VVKTFRFDQSYVVTAEVEVRAQMACRCVLFWRGPLGLATRPNPSSSQAASLSVSRRQGRLNRCKKVGGGATLDQPYDFAAITDLYFAAAFLPDAPARATVVTLHSTIQLPGDPATPTARKSQPTCSVSPWAHQRLHHLRFFRRPKDTDLLKTIHATGPAASHDPRSTRSSSSAVGWVIAKPLYLALRGLDDAWPRHQQLGWAIIIVTVIFTVVMLPLRFML